MHFHGCFLSFTFRDRTFDNTSSSIQAGTTPTRQGTADSHGEFTISTRVEPPIALNKLRVRAQISEIRASDLRFSYEETATFLNKIMSFNLLPEQIAAMETRTEGWIAGLQLFAYRW